MRLRNVPCGEIVPDAPERRYAPEDIDALAADIRANGLLRPILVSPASSGFVIVHGERRWRAAIQAGLQSVPAFIVQHHASREALAA